MKRREKIRIAAALGMTMLWAAQGSGRGDFREGLGEHCGYGLLDLSRESPHTQWAKPLAGGPVKILVLAPTMAQRESIELNSRLDLDLRVWMSASDKDADGSKEGTLSKDPAIQTFYAPPENVRKALDEAMAERYDVYLVGKLYWDAIPANHRDEIARRVNEGAGLVFIQPPHEQPQPAALITAGASQDDRSWIQDRVPLVKTGLFDNVTGEALLTMGTHGSGRVLVLNYGDRDASFSLKADKEKYGYDKVEKVNTMFFHSLTPIWADPTWTGQARLSAGELLSEPLPDNDIPYEYAHSLIARAVLWAAKRQPPQQVHLTAAESFDRDGTIPPVRVWATGAGSENLKIEVALRKGAALHDILAEGPASSEERPVSVPLPRLPRGRHFVDVWLRSDGNIVDWASTAIDVTAPEICRDLLLDKKGVDRGRNVTGRILLARALGDDEKAVLEVEDNLGWVRVRQELPAGSSGESRFSVAVMDTPVTKHLVRVKIMRGANVLETIGKPVYLFDNAWGEDYRAVAWGGIWNARPSEYVSSEMKQLGFDVLDLGCNSTPFQTHPLGRNPKTIPVGEQIIRMRAELSVKHNLDIINYTWSQLGDTAVQDRGIFSAESARKDAEELAPYGCYAYINSEPFAAHKEFEPKDQMIRYRAYLRETYESVAALNRSWGTDYANFESAEYIPLDKAKETGRFAQWADFRFFMEKEFAWKMQEIGQSYVAGDTDSRHGFDAALYGHVWDGIDVWEMAKRLTCLHCYHSTAMFPEMIRSFARPGTITGTWAGSYGPRYGDLGPIVEEYNRYYAWSTIFHGLNSGWWWTTAFGPEPSTGDPSWYPDGRPLPHLARTMEEIREIKRGAGRALLAAKREDNGIAILYSAAFRHGTALLPQDTEPIKREDGTLDALPTEQDQAGHGWMKAFKSWATLIEDAGLQYRIISGEELVDGFLQKEGFKVLVLPYAVALSDGEVEAVRTFASGGGTIFADRRPGLLDKHCKQRDKWVFEDIFPAQAGWKPRQFGKGRALLLGSEIIDYHWNIRNTGKWKDGSDLRNKFSIKLKEMTGIRPFAEVRSATTGPIPPTKVCISRNESLTYVGLLRDYQLRDYEKYPIRVSIEEPRHVYDMRTGEYLGETSAFTTKLDYRARLYACLPYKVQGLEVQVTGSPSRGESAKITASLKTAGGGRRGDHVFRMRLLDGKGREMEGFSRNRTSREGHLEEEIFLPYNLSAGSYQLGVRDVISGLEKTQKMTLK